MITRLRRPKYYYEGIPTEPPLPPEAIREPDDPPQPLRLRRPMDMEAPQQRHRLTPAEIREQV